MRRNRAAQDFDAAQVEELKCWRSIESKLVHPRYLERKRQLWIAIAERASLHQKLSEIVGSKSDTDIRILDLGCGPSGILVVLPELMQGWFPRQEFQFIRVDPLIEEYLKLAPNLLELPVEWKTVTGESLKAEIEGDFDMVLSNNAIDHVLDIDAITYQFLSLLSKGAFDMVSVFCHSYQVLAKLWSVFRVEALHPYQMTAQGYGDPFSRHGGHVEEIFPLDDIYSQFDLALSDVKELTDPPSPMKLRRFVLSLLEMVGLPLLGTSGQDRAIFHNKLFLISPEKPTARSLSSANASAGGHPQSSIPVEQPIHMLPSLAQELAVARYSCCDQLEVGDEKPASPAQNA